MYNCDLAEQDICYILQFKKAEVLDVSCSKSEGYNSKAAWC